MEKINVMIADDHKLIRETWSYILNNDSAVSGYRRMRRFGTGCRNYKDKNVRNIVLMDINILPIVRI